MTSTLTPWSCRAVNLPEHADNPIHTDEGAQAAGFDAAIVAGVSVYAYMTHPPAAAWGESWLSKGGGELKLKRPVLDQQQVRCDVTTHANSPRIEARVDGELCASFDLFQSATVPPMRTGEPLPERQVTLDESRTRYGIRAGDDLDLYDELGCAHPALWPHVANMIFADHLVSGAWIHTRSLIFHQGLAYDGQTLKVVANVIDRFNTKSGERAVADIAFFADERPVARVEHEALVRLNE